MSNDKRQPGYYRGIWAHNENPDIALWNGRGWEKHGARAVGDEDSYKVTDPTPIDPNPAPQPTGQLTAEDALKQSSHEISSSLPVFWQNTFVIDPIAARVAVDAIKRYNFQQTAHLEKQLSIALGTIETMKEDAVANSEPNWQITAEEMPVPVGDFVLKNGRPTQNHDGSYYHYSNVVSMLSQYAAQQTAAKDEEIAALREMFSNCVSLLQGFPIAEPGDFDIGGKHHDWYCKRCDLLESFSMLGTGILGWRQTKDERIKELEGWKKEQMDVTSPLFDYGQSKEAGLPLGGSIVDEAISALKERKGLREELANNYRVIALADKLADQKDERIKELEAQLEASETCRELEATKDKDARIKELEGLYNTSLQTSGILRDQRNEALDKNEEKDARIAELEDVLIRIDWGNGTNWRTDYKKLLSRLSTGKTKHRDNSRRECWTEKELKYCTKEEIDSGRCGCNMQIPSKTGDTKPPEIPNSSTP